MPGVEKLDDVKAAFVHIKVDIAGLEIRGVGFPNLNLGILCFDHLPHIQTDASAVAARVDEKNIQRAPLFSSVDLHDDAADHLTVREDAEGLRRGGVQRLKNILSRDDLFRLGAKGFDGSFHKGVLVPLDETLSFVRLKGPQLNDVHGDSSFGFNGTMLFAFHCSRWRFV